MFGGMVQNKQKKKKNYRSVFFITGEGNWLWKIAEFCNKTKNVKGL
jgi:hypothetical protein